MTHSTPATTGPDRVVVGVDGSASSVEALRWAARTAPLIGCGIDVITTWQYPMAAYGYGAMAPTYRPDEDAAHMLEVVLKDVFDDARPDDLRAVLVEGHPAQILVERSAGAALLVVGSRGHGGFVGLLMGSVSAHCAEHAQCPVTVVHHPAADPS